MKVSIDNISSTSVFMPGDYIMGMVMKVIEREDVAATATAAAAMPRSTPSLSLTLTTANVTIYVRDNSGGTVPVTTQTLIHQQGGSTTTNNASTATVEKGATVRCEDLQARPRGNNNSSSNSSNSSSSSSNRRDVIPLVYRTEVRAGRVTVLGRRLFTPQQMFRSVEALSNYEALAESCGSSSSEGRIVHSIIGVVARVYPRADGVATRLGRTTSRQSLLLTGRGNVLVTLWGSQAAELGATAAETLVEGQSVLLLENAVLSLYNTRLQATAAPDTLLAVDPPVPAAAALLEEVAATSSSTTTAIAASLRVRPEDIVDTYTVVSIARILEEAAERDNTNSSNSPAVYGRLVAAVSYVGLGAAGRVPTFLACPTCRRRVADTHCAHCDKAVLPVATLALRIRAMDSTGEVALTLFGSTAEEFLGVSADDLAQKASTPEARWAVQARLLWVRHSIAFRVSPTGTISVLQCVPYK